MEYYRLHKTLQSVSPLIVLSVLGYSHSAGTLLTQRGEYLCIQPMTALLSYVLCHNKRHFLHLQRPNDVDQMVNRPSLHFGGMHELSSGIFFT